MGYACEERTVDMEPQEVGRIQLLADVNDREGTVRVDSEVLRRGMR